MYEFRVALFFVALVATSIASAEIVPRLEITPYVGYRGGGHLLDVEGEADFESDVSFGVVLNYRATYRTQWELLYGHQSTDLDDSSTSADGSKFGLNLDYLHLGGTYVFSEDALAPFLSLTLGATRLSPDLSDFESETYFSGSIGLGLRYTLSPNLGLRVEGRALGLFGKSDSLVFCQNVDGIEDCFVAGDGSVIPQFEISAGLAFRF